MRRSPLSNLVFAGRVKPEGDRRAPEARRTHRLRRERGNRGSFVVPAHRRALYPDSVSVSSLMRTPPLGAYVCLPLWLVFKSTSWGTSHDGGDLVTIANRNYGGNGDSADDITAVSI